MDASTLNPFCLFKRHRRPGYIPEIRPLLRSTGDYGGIEHVTFDEAKGAVRMAKIIIDAVKKECPEFDVKGKETNLAKNN